MTGVENVNFGLRHVLAVAFRLPKVEREVILTPDYQEARLLLAHPSLPLGVGVDVRAVVVEEIALNVGLARLVEKVKFISPKIRVIAFHVGIVPDMARPRRLQRQKICAKRVFVRSAIFPKFAARLPIRAPAVVVRDRVLNNESFYTLRVPKGHAETDRSAVIVHVKRVTREPERISEVIHDLGDVIERVSEFFRIRPIAVSETRVIGRNEMITIAKPGEQRLKLSRGRGYSVQQQKRWRVFWACFAIEDRQSINLHCAIKSRMFHRTSLSLCVREQLK